jgi:Phenylpropionate dioxygenase and related ring-hydroxylating dioxygenases, large terminal subunit
MGEVFRRYWLPVCVSTQIARPDSDPLRVSLLGERMVAFRDTNGKVGVLQELCPHRGASLAIGRVEECGIRCLYHGWKFAVDGTILDTPNNRDENFKKRVKATAYPVRGGRLGLGVPRTGGEDASLHALRLHGRR